MVADAGGGGARPHGDTALSSGLRAGAGDSTRQRERDVSMFEALWVHVILHDFARALSPAADASGTRYIECWAIAVVTIAAACRKVRRSWGALGREVLRACAALGLLSFALQALVLAVLWTDRVRVRNGWSAWRTGAERAQLVQSAWLSLMVFCVSNCTTLLILLYHLTVNWAYVEWFLRLPAGARDLVCKMSHVSPELGAIVQRFLCNDSWRAFPEVFVDIAHLLASPAWRLYLGDRAVATVLTAGLLYVLVHVLRARGLVAVQVMVLFLMPSYVDIEQLYGEWNTHFWLTLASWAYLYVRGENAASLMLSFVLPTGVPTSIFMGAAVNLTAAFLLPLFWPVIRPVIRMMLIFTFGLSVGLLLTAFKRVFCALRSATRALRKFILTAIASTLAGVATACHFVRVTIPEYAVTLLWLAGLQPLASLGEPTISSSEAQAAPQAVIRRRRRRRTRTRAAAAGGTEPSGGWPGSVGGADAAVPSSAQPAEPPEENDSQTERAQAAGPPSPTDESDDLSRLPHNADERVLRPATTNLGSAPEVTAPPARASPNLATVSEARREDGIDGRTVSTGGETASHEERECVICLDKPRTHAFLPCMHRCVCADCAVKCMQEGSPHCPLCRSMAIDCRAVWL
eukprot:CAMPEP_0119165658 /NCGR_PEP_ID=MMETSP1315-20130426/5283_1 /TAXON_ID=676789 /ORGANISM="Prasinoderma singularis, Strain RCC927" /LENGTH=631 /DNA_ID=CAMNT_0007158955 /DNA_START=126 /DNA_END=2021 /DNA_ORIENTATION=-